MQKPDSTCRQGRDTNPRPVELASQPGSLHCSSESVSPLSHGGRYIDSDIPIRFQTLVQRMQVVYQSFFITFSFLPKLFGWLGGPAEDSATIYSAFIDVYDINNALRQSKTCPGTRSANLSEGLFCLR